MEIGESLRERKCLIFWPDSTDFLIDFRHTFGRIVAIGIWTVGLGKGHTRYEKREAT